ncbi:MAG: hypothetical protein QME60_05995 [Verrucomicrobiota bacterium]|nr:hypothetical protein [Verrucomicrobiota bacterium]
MPRIDVVRRDAEPGIDDHHPPRLAPGRPAREPQRYYPLADPFHEHGAAAYQGRNVAPDAGADLHQRARRQVQVPHGVQSTQNGRRVRATPAQAAADGNPFVNPYPGAAPPPRRPLQSCRSLRCQVVAGRETARQFVAGHTPNIHLGLDAGPSFPYGHRVAQRHRDDHATDRVVAVRPFAKDFQTEVDLGPRSECDPVGPTRHDACV